MDIDTRLKLLGRIAIATAERLSGVQRSALNGRDQAAAVALEELGILLKHPDDPDNFVGPVNPSFAPKYEEST